MQATESADHFSVGISLRSLTLRVAEVAPFAVSFGEEWKPVRVRTFGPTSRPGVAAETGAHVHSHLRDAGSGVASANILRARSVVTSSWIDELRQGDPTLEIDIHVKQDFPDVGSPKPVVLVRGAVAALAETRRDDDAGFDIDQYAGSVPRPVETVLSWVCSRLPTHQRPGSLTFSSADGQPMIGCSFTGRRIDDDALATIAAELLLLSTPPQTATITTTYDPFGPIGAGLWLSAPLLRLVRDSGVDLVLCTRVRPLSSVDLFGARQRRAARTLSLNAEDP